MKKLLKKKKLPFNAFAENFIFVHVLIIKEFTFWGIDYNDKYIILTNR